MEVCVDSVQSALNAERGGECLHFQRLSEFNFADSSGRKEVSSCCMLHAVASDPYLIELNVQRVHDLCEAFIISLEHVISAVSVEYQQTLFQVIQLPRQGAAFDRH